MCLAMEKIAGIDRQAKREIGFNGVHALILQGVGADFVDQADAAPLLAQIGNAAAPRLLHRPHRRFKLRAAVALARKQRVARETLRMHPRQNRQAV